MTTEESSPAKDLPMLYASSNQRLAIHIAQQPLSRREIRPMATAHPRLATTNSDR